MRRYTDITRDVHGEFAPSRRLVSDFPSESEEEAYVATERALVAAVRFLQAVFHHMLQPPRQTHSTGARRTRDRRTGTSAACRRLSDASGCTPSKNVATEVK